ncbi:hypothetical protein AB0I00_00615 [Streptomyces sp. NPDC050803]|uniref:hypothetical protein n=1 Tax=unclassified Streptomyces TaxID=2593676 RepID=UPI0034351704
MSGELPEGPETVAPYQLDVIRSEETVGRLARALGLPKPQDTGTHWSHDPNGGRPLFTVFKNDIVPWAFERGWKRPADGPRLDPGKAKAAVLPVLRALGLEESVLTTAPGAGSWTEVTADPVLGGVPTEGWSVKVSVDGEGRVMAASGLMGRPRRLDPVEPVGAKESLLLNGDEIAGPGTASELPGVITRHREVPSARLYLRGGPCMDGSGFWLEPVWEFGGGPDGKRVGRAVPTGTDCA